MARIGTFSPRVICERLKTGNWLHVSLGFGDCHSVDLGGTHKLENGGPLSLAVAQSNLLPDVTEPFVPLTKQTANAQPNTTAAARLPVA